MMASGRLASLLAIVALLQGQTAWWCVLHHHDQGTQRSSMTHDHHATGSPQQSHCSRSITDCNSSNQPSLSPSVPSSIDLGLILPGGITTALASYSASFHSLTLELADPPPRA